MASPTFDRQCHRGAGEARGWGVVCVYPIERAPAGNPCATRWSRWRPPRMMSCPCRGRSCAPWAKSRRPGRTRRARSSHIRRGCHITNLCVTQLLPEDAANSDFYRVEANLYTASTACPSSGLDADCPAPPTPPSRTTAGRSRRDDGRVRVPPRPRRVPRRRRRQR